MDGFGLRDLGRMVFEGYLEISLFDERIISSTSFFVASTQPCVDQVDDGCEPW